VVSKAELARQEKNSNLLESVSHGVPVPSVCTQAESLYIKIKEEMPADCGVELPIYQQLLKCINSVSACIMEGLGYADAQQQIRFLKMSRGSALESCVHARCLQSWVDSCSSLSLAVDNYIADRLSTLL